MAILNKKTIQRLATLYALSLWSRGAYGPVRLQKTLFFADKDNEAGWRLFTFKKYYLGQFSDELAESLNDLREMGRIKSRYDGPSERLTANIPVLAGAPIKRFFHKYFRKWHVALQEAFEQIAYLSNDAILAAAHEDPTYKTSQHGQVIFKSFTCPSVEFADLPDETAEALSDLVTSYVRQELRAIADSSNAVKHLLRKALEELEQNPSSFPPLEEVPGNLTASYPNLTLRKIKLRSGKHNYRLVVAHWTLESGAEHADVLYCRQASGAWLGFGSYEVSVAGEPCRPTKDPGGSSCRTIWENRNCLAEWRSRPPPACLAGEQVLKAKRRFQYFFGTPASSPGR